MHLLAKLPADRTQVLVACPVNCTANSKVVQLKEHHGAGTFLRDTFPAGVYRDDSFVCVAAKEHTHVDGGLFLLALQSGHSDEANEPLDERSFTIKKTVHPFALDSDKDGGISESEAAAAKALFKGVGGVEGGVETMSRVFQLTAQSVAEMDANHDLFVTQQEHLAWMFNQLEEEGIRRINSAHSHQLEL
jgi:hypothetical protein